jgi:hypothetical protein
LRRTGPDESWTNEGQLPGGQKLRSTDPTDQRINPRTLSDDDIRALKARYEDTLRSDKATRLNWLDEENSYREKVRPQIEASRGQYNSIVGGAGVDQADRQIIKHMIDNHSAHLWLQTEEEAQRIFHTLDEMAYKPHFIDSSDIKFAPRPATGPGDLPFRGPEHHPFDPTGADRGANPMRHFNVEYVHPDGADVNIHIYWGKIL